MSVVLVKQKGTNNLIVPVESVSVNSSEIRPLDSGAPKPPEPHKKGTAVGIGISSVIPIQAMSTPYLGRVDAQPDAVHVRRMAHLLKRGTNASGAGGGPRT